MKTTKCRTKLTRAAREAAHYATLEMATAETEAQYRAARTDYYRATARVAA